MVKAYSFICLIFILLSCKHEAPVLSNEESNQVVLKYVSDTIENRHVVLEVFDGVVNELAPTGHQEARRIQLKALESTHLIRVESGGFSIPRDGHPDFRTRYGDSLLLRSQSFAFPSGNINRGRYFGKGVVSGGIAMTSRFWSETATAVLSQQSSMNIGGNAVFNRGTRQMTVDIEVYYTQEQSSKNQLHLALTESNIKEKQAGLGDNYNHNNILCDLFLGLDGEAISAPTTKGTQINRRYTFYIKQTYNRNRYGNGLDPKPENFELIAFVTQDSGRIETANRIPITIN